MRLCEREGAFDFAAYQALKTEVTWEEAMRINAALVVIGDERAAYSEWRSSSAGKAGAPMKTPALSLADYERELTEAREEERKAQQMLILHRRAVHERDEAGRLPDQHVEHFQLVVSICKKRIAAIEEHLQAMAEQAAANEVSDG